MALIGASDKRCVVGRAGHSAKTKTHRGREIDVLIFPIEEQAAGNSARRRGHGGKMCSLLFPFRRLLFARGEKRSKNPSREASGAGGLEVLAAGRRLCERNGYYCYKFHHLSQMRKMDGRILEWEAEPDEVEEAIVWV